jgi:hypothetical protein
VAAIRLPARLARGKVFIRVSDAAVMLLAEFVFRRVWIGVAAQPELLNERVPLLIVAQVLEGFGLLVGDDPEHILIQPGLVGALQLLPYRLLGGELLLVGALALQRVRFLALAGSRLSLLLGRCGRIGRLLGQKPNSGDENEAATQCGKQKTTTVKRHCLQNSCEPLFYGSR